MMARSFSHRALIGVPALLLTVALTLAPAATGLAADGETPDPPGTGAPWSEIVDGEVVVDLYFVWSSTCPHCRAAHPFVEDLEDTYPWLRVHWLQVDTDDPAPVDTAIALADSLDQVIQGVPTFLFCEQMLSGYDDAEGLGAHIETELLRCRAQLDPGDGAPEDDPPDASADDENTVTIPIIGEVNADDVSLPAFTVAIAAVDAFNPCAFFVLLFLLSLLVHARSRLRMAVVGGVFVLFSGLIYFAFMTAWLNVFLVTESIRWITIVAGSIAIVIAAVNIKDAFVPDRGPSLSIPERAKPGLFARMRELVAADRYPAMLGGTVALAVAANSYELLCTAGLPMAFTRVLTLNELPTATYYLYLVLYNVIYVIPLLLIVAGFVFALGSRKLQEYEGRGLKLLSGMMMLGLGGILLLAPDLLNNPATAILVLAAAILATVVITLVGRMRARQAVPH